MATGKRIIVHLLGNADKAQVLEELGKNRFTLLDDLEHVNTLIGEYYGASLDKLEAIPGVESIVTAGKVFAINKSGSGEDAS